MEDAHSKTTAIPRSVVMVLVYDPSQRAILTLWRGPDLRSVPNCRSFISGMQEWGETLEEACRREVLEETNLVVGPLVHLGAIDSLPGDGYHWVLNCFLAPLYREQAKFLKNLEPTKHSSFAWLGVGNLVTPPDVWNTVIKLLEFHKPDADWLSENRVRIWRKCNAYHPLTREEMLEELAR